jgi:hypothetical protein
MHSWSQPYYPWNGVKMSVTFQDNWFKTMHISLDDEYYNH